MTVGKGAATMVDRGAAARLAATVGGGGDDGDALASLSQPLQQSPRCQGDGCSG